MFALLAAVLCVEFLIAAACFTGQHYGSDFVEFWAASRLGLEGHAADIYNGTLLFRVEKSAVPTLRNSTPWFYPPTFYLVVLPLACLPYKFAYWTFELLTLALYVGVFRRITSNWTATWCLAAFPGLWVNLLYGQNGFLTAALAASAILCLKRKPTLAGVFIGLLLIKPHLTLLFPVALLAAKAWRACISAAVTTAAFLLVSARVIGTAALKQNLAALSYARALLETGVCQDKMPTVFSFLRTLGMSVRAAYCVQGLVALLAGAAVWRVWRSCEDARLRGAALMTATLMVSPYLQVYDLTWLAFPIVWLALAGKQSAWLTFERTALVAAWLLPFQLAEVAVLLHLQLGPWIVGSLVWLAVRRAKTPGLSERTLNIQALTT